MLRFAWCLAFSLLPSGGRVKTKNPPPYGGGFDKFRENSKPVRHAAKRQRPALRDKQQVQVVVHASTLVALPSAVKFSVGGLDVGIWSLSAPRYTRRWFMP
jgi:hypothetical protein